MATAPIPENARLLKKGELAEFLGVSVRSIENRMRDGLPAIPIGRCKRFDRSEVLAWLRNRQDVA